MAIYTQQVAEHFWGALILIHASSRDLEEKKTLPTEPPDCLELMGFRCPR